MPLSSRDPRKRSGVEPRIVPVGYVLRAERIRATVWVPDPGESIPQGRQRRQKELFHVIEGTAEMTVDEDTVEVNEGTPCPSPEIPCTGSQQ